MKWIPCVLAMLGAWGGASLTHAQSEGWDATDCSSMAQPAPIDCDLHPDKCRPLTRLPKAKRGGEATEPEALGGAAPAAGRSGLPD